MASSRLQPYEKPSLTHPKPFVLQTSERAELRPSTKATTGEVCNCFCKTLGLLPFLQYVPLSVQVARWMHDTPPRLKRQPEPVQSRPLERTIPQPFNLLTNARAIHHLPLPPPTPTFAQFKATPLDHRVCKLILTWDLNPGRCKFPFVDAFLLVPCHLPSADF